MRVLSYFAEDGEVIGGGLVPGVQQDAEHVLLRSVKQLFTQRRLTRDDVADHRRRTANLLRRAWQQKRRQHVLETSVNTPNKY